MRKLKEYIIEMAEDMPLSETDLKNLFLKFNKKYFGSELDIIPIKYNKRSKSLGLFYSKYNKINNIDVPDKIEISSEYKIDEKDIENILIHEMIHYYILKNYPEEFKVQHHGYNFKRIMNIINKQGEHEISIKIEKQLGRFINKEFPVFIFKFNGKIAFIKTNKNSFDSIGKELQFEEIRGKSVRDIRYFYTSDDFFQIYRSKRTFNGYYLFTDQKMAEKYYDDAKNNEITPNTNFGKIFKD